MPLDVIIASEDPSTIRELNAVFLERKYSVTIEHSKLKSILKTLDATVNLLFLDITKADNAIFDFVTIIKKTRPKIKIITVSESQIDSQQSQLKLRSLGIFYALTKPIHRDELDHVLNAIESKTDFNFNHILNMPRILL